MSIENQPDHDAVDESQDGQGASLDVPTVSAFHMLAGNKWALLLDVVLPFVAYQLLVRQGLSSILALSLTSVFPLASTFASWLRERRAETLGLISLVFIAAGLAATLVTRNAMLTLMKGSLFTGSFGLAFIGSLLLPRPLAFYLGRQMMTEGKPEAIARWNALWQYRGFRHGNRVVSLVWGSGLLLEAALRVVLALRLSTSTFLVLWPLLRYAIYAGLLVWTVAYARR